MDDLDLAIFGKGLQRQRWICLFIPKNPWDFMFGVKLPPVLRPLFGCH